MGSRLMGVKDGKLCIPVQNPVLAYDMLPRFPEQRLTRLEALRGEESLVCA